MPTLLEEKRIFSSSENLDLRLRMVALFIGAGVRDMSGPEEVVMVLDFAVMERDVMCSMVGV